MMSVRKEDSQKSSISGKGLGLVAAAIGVGVGAALYYIVSGRRDNEQAASAHTATSSAANEWSLRQKRALNNGQWKVEPCSICCETMMMEDDLYMLPCGHKFHTTCVRQWLDEKQNCPVCRHEA